MSWAMDSTHQSITPEEILAHAAWLNRLARQLVNATAAADDIAQETWVAAVRTPPERGRPLRPWLGEVVRFM